MKVLVLLAATASAFNFGAKPASAPASRGGATRGAETPQKFKPAFGAPEILQQRAAEREARDYRSDEAPTLLMRMEQGEPPAWLRPVELPDELAEQFRLYEVN